MLLLNERRVCSTVTVNVDIVYMQLQIGRIKYAHSDNYMYYLVGPRLFTLPRDSHTHIHTDTHLTSIPFR